MKTILCYGDSNTFGYNPQNGSRYDKNERWCGILANKLPSDYLVIEEGMNNRTGFVDNPDGLIFSAQKHFPQIINSFDNIDTLFLSVGINDLQFAYNIDLECVPNKLEHLINIAKNKTDNIILFLPIVLDERILNGYFKIMFNQISINKSQKLGNIYKTVAEKTNCKIFDINKYAKVSDFDGLHYDIKAHRIIADTLKELYFTS